MKNNKMVVILYNKIQTNTKDELDVIVQVQEVAKVLRCLGYKTQEVTFSEDLNGVIEKLRKIDPAFVFNLVESFEGNGRLLYMAASILDFLKIQYTGGNVENLFITTDKILTKSYLKSSGIKTPEWVTLSNLKNFVGNTEYILKPICEDASIDINEDSVIYISKIEKLIDFLLEKKNKTGMDYFAERYIEGREFNISMLGSNGQPELFPPAEIVFKDYPEDKKKIVDYNAKWNEDSYEYANTVRTFDFKDEDKNLLIDISRISKDCWNILGLKGYVRVDFRIDSKGIPWVLEINSNPCISPDSGFTASLQRKHINYTDMIKRIIKEI